MLCTPAEAVLLIVVLSQPEGDGACADEQRQGTRLFVSFRSLHTASNSSQLPCVPPPRHLSRSSNLPSLHRSRLTYAHYVVPAVALP